MALFLSEITFFLLNQVNRKKFHVLSKELESYSINIRLSINQDAKSKNQF